MKRSLLPAALAAALAACIPYPGELPPEDRPRTSIVEGPFAPLDAGASELESLHFKVKAYGGEAARRVADAAEQDYNRVMVDTGLYSFKPRGLYQLVIYASQDEYRRKTAQPEWSGGVAVGNAIFSWDGPQLRRVLSHEMTHLIVYEYMGRSRLEHRWVNEGLAVYEESKAADSRGQDPFASVRTLLRTQPLPMEQVIRLIPASEKDYLVSLWYAQSESMVRFMIERGGRIGFAQFLGCLRDDKSFDVAVSESFGGHWTSLADFERDWLRSLQ